MPNNKQKNTNYCIFIASVIRDKCTGCEKCIKVCPADAITITSERKALINSELCRGCGICATICKRQAIIFKKPENLKQ